MAGIKRDKIDRIVSLIVRTRDKWTCQRCLRVHPPPSQLDCAHIWGRARKGTRYAPDNCVALCRGCHQHFTSHPLEFRDWVVRRLGQRAYDLLEYRARSVCKRTQAEKELLYQELKAELKRCSGEG